MEYISKITVLEKMFEDVTKRVFELEINQAWLEHLELEGRDVSKEKTVNTAQLESARAFKDWMKNLILESYQTNK